MKKYSMVGWVLASLVAQLVKNLPAMQELLLPLSRFSRVRLCATPQTAAHQAPPSLGFSRQEHWSGLPFPSPMHEREKGKWSRSVMSDSWWPHGLQPTRLLRPWDFPGKSTGVGCHCLLRQCRRPGFNSCVAKISWRRDRLLTPVFLGFPCGSAGKKNLPAMQKTWVRSLSWKDPLEKGKATHSSILAWRIAWTV